MSKELRALPNLNANAPKTPSLLVNQKTQRQPLDTLNLEELLAKRPCESPSKSQGKSEAHTTINVFRYRAYEHSGVYLCNSEHNRVKHINSECALEPGGSQELTFHLTEQMGNSQV